MSKTKKRKHSANNHRANGIIMFLVLLIGGLSWYVLTAPVSKKSVIDSPQTEMLMIPQALKQHVLSATTNQETFRIPILMYHYVEYVKDLKDLTRQKLNIVPHIFDSQLKTLKDAGYTFLTARDVGFIIDGKKKLPEKPIVITFDDGHWDLATDVLPILQKYNVYATAYIIPGFTGQSDFMTEAQMREVIKSGLVEIGAHTVHHISLKGQTRGEVEKEVVGSKRMLEDTYHISVVSFAYPNGSFDEQAAEVTKEAGFTTGVSTIPGVIQHQANRYFLYRLRPGDQTGEQLLHYLSESTFNPW